MISQRERAKLEKALARFAAATGANTEELKPGLEEALYTDEDHMYEGQSVLNFFTFRIKPILEGKKPGETEIKYRVRKEEWERAYHEWKIRRCEGCQEDFAYALNYEGVKYCSLYCLDKALKDIGLQVTRGRDIRKRWGVQQHPAIVPSSAFQALKETYSSDASAAFCP